MGLIPVIATIGADADGQTYNINADDAATAVAERLGAQKLVFLSDVAGLLADVDRPESLIAQVDVDAVEGLIADGTVSGGMVPKLTGCARAVRHGVGSVHLVDGRLPHVLLLELFTDAGVGTMVTGSDS
jgi:acetylglutamate kinase